MSEDINVLALVKGAERYIFLYDDSNRAETLRTLGRYASDPDLSFTWYDAAVLSQKIRQQTQQRLVPLMHTIEVADRDRAMTVLGFQVVKASNKLHG